MPQKTAVPPRTAHLETSRPHSTGAWPQWTSATLPAPPVPAPMRRAREPPPRTGSEPYLRGLQSTRAEENSGLAAAVWQSQGVGLYSFSDAGVRSSAMIHRSASCLDATGAAATPSQTPWRPGSRGISPDKAGDCARGSGFSTLARNDVSGRLPVHGLSLSATLRSRNSGSSLPEPIASSLPRPVVSPRHRVRS